MRGERVRPAAMKGMEDHPAVGMTVEEMGAVAEGVGMMISF
jgi:hypothetical protein